MEEEMQTTPITKLDKKYFVSFLILSIITFLFIYASIVFYRDVFLYFNKRLCEEWGQYCSNKNSYFNISIFLFIISMLLLVTLLILFKKWKNNLEIISGKKEIIFDKLQVVILIITILYSYWYSRFLFNPPGGEVFLLVYLLKLIQLLLFIGVIVLAYRASKKRIPTNIFVTILTIAILILPLVDYLISNEITAMLAEKYYFPIKDKYVQRAAFDFEFTANGLTNLKEIKDGSTVNLLWDAHTAEYCKPGNGPIVSLVGGGFWGDLGKLKKSGNKNIIAKIKTVQPKSSKDPATGEIITPLPYKKSEFWVAIECYDKEGQRAAKSISISVKE